MRVNPDLFDLALQRLRTEADLALFRCANQAAAADTDPELTLRIRLGPPNPVRPARPYHFTLQIGRTALDLAAGGKAEWRAGLASPRQTPKLTTDRRRESLPDGQENDFRRRCGNRGPQGGPYQIARRGGLRRHAEGWTAHGRSAGSFDRACAAGRHDRVPRFADL
ncbi:protein of unknown function [Methylocella tundrae]|uniref:Uncharacterized protein n=1 Tax=Methylocella tundrae TaxID=227605 RepID=A0A4U8Z0U0_METTU|nr:protein of unknown function [Methylocella tundrae]